MELPGSPKVGLGKDYPMLNVDDVVPQVKKANRTNYHNYSDKFSSDLKK